MTLSISTEASAIAGRMAVILSKVDCLSGQIWDGVNGRYLNHPPGIPEAPELMSVWFRDEVAVKSSLNDSIRIKRLPGLVMIAVMWQITHSILMAPLKSTTELQRLSHHLNKPVNHVRCPFNEKAITFRTKTRFVLFVIVRLPMGSFNHKAV
jgi:hypothetical protein